MKHRSGQVQAMSDSDLQHRQTARLNGSAGTGHRISRMSLACYICVCVCGGGGISLTCCMLMDWKAGWLSWRDWPTWLIVGGRHPHRAGSSGAPASRVLPLSEHTGLHRVTWAPPTPGRVQRSARLPRLTTVGTHRVTSGHMGATHIGPGPAERPLPASYP